MQYRVAGSKVCLRHSHRIEALSGLMSDRLCIGALASQVVEYPLNFIGQRDRVANWHHPVKRLHNLPATSGSGGD